MLPGGRGLLEIKLRGRWRAGRSVARYQKEGRVAEQLGRFGAASASGGLGGAACTGSCPRAALRALRQLAGPGGDISSSRSAAAQGGWLRRCARNMLALEWGTLNGPLWDLTRRGARRALRGSSLAGQVWGLHMGTPCSSFSRARGRGPPWQPGVPSYPMPPPQ